MIIKPSIYLLCILLMLSYPVKAQSSLSKIDTNYRRPYVMINGNQVAPLSLILLTSAHIKSLNIVSPGKTNKYGKQATKFGLVEITLKKDVQLVDINDLVRLYHIKANVIQLPVTLSFGLSNEKLQVGYPHLLRAVKTEVQKVGVRREYGKAGADLWIIKTMNFANQKQNRLNYQLDSLNNIFREEAKRRYPLPEKVIIR